MDLFGITKPSGSEPPVTTRDLQAKRDAAERDAAHRRQREQRAAIEAKRDAERAEQAAATQARLEAAAAERRKRIEADTKATFLRNGGTAAEWAMVGSRLTLEAVQKAGQTEQTESAAAVRRSYATQF